MILLTDEEIQKSIQYEDDGMGIVITDPVFYPKTNLRSKKIAKAQLKKVVELLRGSFETAESCEGKHSETYCKACVDETMRSLLKEEKE